jgi:hypothetical protein
MSAMRSQLATKHGEMISWKGEVQRAKGNLRQDRFVQETEMASLVEKFERKKA